MFIIVFSYAKEGKFDKTKYVSFWGDKGFQNWGDHNVWRESASLYKWFRKLANFFS